MNEGMRQLLFVLIGGSVLVILMYLWLRSQLEDEYQQKGKRN